MEGEKSSTVEGQVVILSLVAPGFASLCGFAGEWADEYEVPALVLRCWCSLNKKMKTSPPKQGENL